jgi:hypothetical protein
MPSHPAFNMVVPSRLTRSMNIGGRTAWSSRVVVDNRVFSARYWYDGKNVNNAKEDAAEVALNYFKTA